MGNYITCRPRNFSPGKVILSDGSIQEFDKPLTVAELMLEHPQQVVVEFDRSNSENQKKPIPLPADKNLEPKKVYLMLPMKQGKPVPLTSKEARRILLNVARTRSLLSSSRFLQLFAKICSPNVGDGTNFVVQKEIIEDRNSVVDRWVPMSEMLTESDDGRPEFLSRQVSGKGWKPSLDTIKEKKTARKVTHWLF